MPSSLSADALPSSSMSVRSLTEAGQESAATGESLTQVTLTVTGATSLNEPSDTVSSNWSVSPEG